MDECVDCSYFYDDECHFIEDESGYADAGIDCVITLTELLEDMI